MLLSHLVLRLWSLGVKVYRVGAFYKMLAICKMLSDTHPVNCTDWQDLGWITKSWLGLEGEWVCRISTIHKQRALLSSTDVCRVFQYTLVKNTVKTDPLGTHPFKVVFANKCTAVKFYNLLWVFIAQEMFTDKKQNLGEGRETHKWNECLYSCCYVIWLQVHY